MVAPIVPFVGRALMGIGADIGGSTAARSAAGSILSTGKGAGIKEAVQTKEMYKNIKTTSRAVDKILNTLSKHSPMLQQQMIILNKSISLFLRPIGDILAKFVRPMAIWLIKVAMKWNQLFGGGTGDNSSKAAKEDQIQQLKKEETAAKMRGDTTAAAEASKKAEKLQAEVDQPNWFAKGMTNFEDYLQRAANRLSSLFDTDTWKGVGEWAKKVYDDYLVPGMKGALDWATDINKNYIIPGMIGALKWATDINKNYIIPGMIGALKWAKDIQNNYIIPGMLGALKWSSDIWDKYIAVPFSNLLTWGKDIWDTYVSKGFENVINFGTDIWTYFSTGFSDVVNWGTKIWNWIKAGLDKLNPFSSPKKAVGGPVRETGLYTLHAGERIMTAGDTSRAKAKSASSATVNNYINLNAQVSTEIDIRSLARKLAAYSETELRRRVSYT